jgi:hypothetical protein
LSDKDFKVKNKLQVKGITSAGPVISDSSGNLDSTTYIATQYGGTGTSTSPNAGQFLYSESGTNYTPTTFADLVTPITYSDDAPSSPVTGQIWVESDSSATAFDTNIITRQAFTATSNQTDFTTTQTFIDGHEQVYFNGMLLLRGTDYTTENSNNIVLAQGAAASDILEVLIVTNLSTYIPVPYSTLNSDTNLVAGMRYYVSSSNTALTLTLPSSPAVNDQIDIFDASGNAATYNITVARNTKKINGVTGNLIIDTNGSWMTLVYTGSAYGWKAA